MPLPPITPNMPCPSRDRIDASVALGAIHTPAEESSSLRGGIDRELRELGRHQKRFRRLPPLLSVGRPAAILPLPAARLALCCVPSPNLGRTRGRLRRYGVAAGSKGRDYLRIPRPRNRHRLS